MTRFERDALPCPFCGGRAKQVPGECILVCTRCFAKAIDSRWNLRDTSPQPPSDQGLRERLLHAIERYCGDADIGKGASKKWTEWKADFADQLIAALAKREEEISGDIMDDETEKEWLDRVSTPAPDALREATFKEIARAVRSADAGFEASGDAGTKTWIEEYFLPSLGAGGLTIMARDALASKKGGE
jgi:hypothetical protein